MLSNLKTKLFKSIKSKKLNVFGFFFLLSFLFLIITKLSKTYTDTIPFQILMKDVPEAHSILPEHDSIINIKISAYGFNLLWHNFLDHKVTIDFDKEVKTDGSNYVWDASKATHQMASQLGTSVKVLSVDPETIVFPYEIMAIKTVPVVIDAEINYAAGFDLMSNLNAVPDSVKVIGAKKTVNMISNVKTKKLRLKDVNSPINKSVILELDKSMKKIKLSQNTVKVTGEVGKFTEGQIEVPINVVNLPADVKLNFFPKTVLVSYYVDLDSYKSIKALDFKVECDYGEVKSNERTFFVPHLVQTPPKVKTAKIKQNKIEFIIIE